MSRPQCGNFSPACFKQHVGYLIGMKPERRKEFGNMLESGAELKEAEEQVGIEGSPESWIKPARLLVQLARPERRRLLQVRAAIEECRF